MSNNELAKKIHQIQELKRMEEELTAEIESLTDEVKAEMTAQNAEELVVDCFKVRWKTVATSRIDTTALKKELPDVAERFTKTTESRRFTIN